MSDQWRGPGWWVGDDGLWYPPGDEPDHAADRWKRRSGWIDEHDEVGADETTEAAEMRGARRGGPISTGRSIIQAATGTGDLQDHHADHRQLVLDEAFDVIDLRARYREELLADAEPIAPDPSGQELEKELVAAVPDHASSLEPTELADGSEARAARPVEPASVAATRPRPDPQPQSDPPSIVGAAGSGGDGPGAVRSTAPSAAEDRSRSTPEPEPPSTRRFRSGPVLLLLATALAVTSGVLGALWVRERDANQELLLQLEQIQVADDATAAEIEELTDQIGTLEIRNEQLAQQLQEAQSLVAPVPEGRLSVIDIPFDPIFVDEVRGQFIALGSTGQYVVWGSGVDQQITDSGVVDGTPTGLYAARDQAFVSTDTGQVMVLSLTGGEDGVPITTGLLTALAQENRQFWGFAPEANEIRRYRSTNGRLTTSVAVPSTVSELTIGAGAVWALGEEDTIYRVNTADFTLTPITAGQDLVAVTAGPDALWTLSAADGSLRRIDAVSGEVLVTVPVGRDPIDAEFSGNSIWVALRSGSTLVEVDTRTSAVVSRTSLPAEPVALSPGETGVLVILDAEDPLVRVASD